MRVNCTRHAVGNFDVELRDGVFYADEINKIVLRSNNETRTRIDGSITDIPDGSTLYHVPHCEALDSLILCHAARAVGAAHEFDVTASLLVAAAISSFLGLRPETIISYIQNASAASAPKTTQTATIPPQSDMVWVL